MHALTSDISWLWSNETLLTSKAFPVPFYSQRNLGWAIFLKCPIIHCYGSTKNIIILRCLSYTTALLFERPPTMNATIFYLIILKICFHRPIRHSWTSCSNGPSISLPELNIVRCFVQLKFFLSSSYVLKRFMLSAFQQLKCLPA